MADVYTMKLDGSDRRRLTDFKSMSWAPYFHPTGRYVIFASNKHGFANFELFLVDARGEREPVRVTFTEGFDGLPVFSPDGTKLCWTSGRSLCGPALIALQAMANIRSPTKWTRWPSKVCTSSMPRSVGERP